MSFIAFIFIIAHRGNFYSDSAAAGMVILKHLYNSLIIVKLEKGEEVFN